MLADGVATYHSQRSILKVSNTLNNKYDTEIFFGFSYLPLGFLNCQHTIIVFTYRYIGIQKLLYLISILLLIICSYFYSANLSYSIITLNSFCYCYWLESFHNALKRNNENRWGCWMRKIPISFCLKVDRTFYFLRFNISWTLNVSK